MLMQGIDEALTKMPRATGSSVQVGMSRALNQMFEESEKIASDMKDEYVSTEHLLLGMAQPKAGEIKNLLSLHGVDYNAVMQALAAIRGSLRVTNQTPEAQYEALAKYGRDLTDEARKGKLDPVIEGMRRSGV
jgi:ATP-dependent Clp protease ATP-binding subunit ClpB